MEQEPLRAAVALEDFDELIVDALAGVVFLRQNLLLPKLANSSWA